ncbi:hypothetical protein LMTR13_26150 [Bradyrhizobium icense]|uniref:Uncharacterized protein n=1 Tax=Bradyrhizobium icense TaxID=1274631 RepID=A0A1B1UK73_9BRAD|nr:hypothetical protein LMTR13_26150 [Bradyrhizobium icense]
MSPTHRIIQEPSGTRFSRIVSFLYGSAADIAFFITILCALGFASGLLVPKTIDTGGQKCINSLAVEGSDGSVCHPTQHQDAQALQRLLDTISAEAH